MLVGYYIFSIVIMFTYCISGLNQVLKNLELGLAALSGEKGPAYDRIVLNAAMVDHLLGCTGAEDIKSALDRAREAIDSGKALSRLMNYIKISHKVS
jgi:anthranilate phosphoribosyltransferase